MTLIQLMHYKLEIYHRKTILKISAQSSKQEKQSYLFIYTFNSITKLILCTSLPLFSNRSVFMS